MTKSVSGEAEKDELPLRDWAFDLQDQTRRRYTGVTVRARTLDNALKEARKYVKRFTLPGWRLVCDGIEYPAVQFVNESNPKDKKKQWL